MSTETTNKKIKIDNGTTFGRTYTDKAVDAKLPTDLIASANKLSLGVGNAPLGSGVNLSGFTYDEATKTLKASGGGGSISVIELTDKNGTIASAQLGKINANPQNFAFKYNGKILPFTKVDSTTYQYCNNTTNSSDNNVMTTSVLLTITSSTGAYTITENVHNVVANSIHPVNGGDLTNIQVGSKVYSIPSGGGTVVYKSFSADVVFPAKEYQVGEEIFVMDKRIVNGLGYWVRIYYRYSNYVVIDIDGVKFIPVSAGTSAYDNEIYLTMVCIKGGTTLKEHTYTVTLVYSNLV